MKRLRMWSILVIFQLTLFSCVSIDSGDAVGNAQGLKSPDAYTLTSKNSFLNGYAPVNNEGALNVVVEIPTGTVAKWEVAKPDGNLRWEFEKGKPRKVNYLGYPGNYGMIPGTLFPKESGGDGDPLDAIVLGPAVPRGSVVNAKLIGVLKLMDRGERDDKLIAVLKDTPFYKIGSIKELDEQFSGVTQILDIWFSNYKGPGKIITKGFGDAEEAEGMLDLAIRAFSQHDNFIHRK